MKIVRNILLTLLLTLCVFTLGNIKKVNAASTKLTSGTEIAVTNITGNLNNVNVKFEFTTSVNLDGESNALLVGLMSSDGTVLTDTRCVASATQKGLIDEDGVALLFETSPLTIGKKTGTSSFTYTIESRDFTIVNSSKNIAKLVIVGQKGAEISAQVNVSEVKYSVTFGSASPVQYSYNAVIAAPSTTQYTYDINGHTPLTTWTGNDSYVFVSGTTKATKDITYSGSGTKSNHTWTNVSEVAATNTKDGVKAHQECSVCGAKRLSSTSTVLATDADLKIPAIVHSHTYKATFSWPTTPGAKPTVTYKCSDTTCNDTHVMNASDVTITEKSKTNPTYSADGSVTYTASCTYEGVKATENKTYTIPKLTHTLTHHAASPATCTKDGTIEYWSCSDCNKLFADEFAVTEITSIVEKAHHTLVKVPAKAATPTATGNIEYYQCSVCKKNFLDSQGKTEAGDVTITYSANIVYHPEVPATCTEDGIIAYYQNTDTNKNYKDAQCTIEVTDLTIPKSHTLVHVDAQEATCTTVGNIEYYHCSACEKNFKDAEGTIEASDLFIPNAHSLVKYNSKKATCEKDGCIEYYECSVCHKKFKDAEGKNQVTNVVIASPGHQYGSDGVCTVCGKTDPNHSSGFDIGSLLESFGCASTISSLGIVGILSLGVVFLRRKKKYLE